MPKLSGNRTKSNQIQIFWIGNTDIQISETFVRNNLETLNRIGELKGISGALTLNYSGNQNLSAIGFAHPLEFKVEKLLRKIFGINAYYRRVDWLFQLRHGGGLKLSSPGILYIQFASTAALIANSVLASGMDFVIQIHGVDISAMLKIEEYKNRFLKLANNRCCKGVVGNSHHLKRLAILAGVESRKCIVLRNALDVDNIKRDASKPKTERPSFVHLGRLTGKKHPIASFEAFRIVHSVIPESTMTFIGDGPLRGELESRIGASGLCDSVRVLGALNHRSALDIIQRHWVFVQHSVTSMLGDQEGFPNSGAEAALLELPIVATYHNGFPEQVIDGKTGYLVPEFNYELMAERMIELAQRSDLREQFGIEGRKHILSMCHPQERLRQMRRIIMDALN